MHPIIPPLPGFALKFQEVHFYDQWSIREVRRAGYGLATS